MAAGFKNVRILILGAKGQLGMSLTEKLNSNFEKELNYLALSKEQLDIENARDVETWINSYRPNFVINCAAWTNVVKAETEYESAKRINFGGVVNIAHAAAKFESKLIQISTDYVFDGTHIAPIAESELQNPINCYGKTKSDAEIFLTQEYPEISVIIRTAWLYGPYGSNFAKTIIGKALSGEKEKIQVVSDHLGQPTSTLDLASKILEMIISNIDVGIYHGTNSGSISWYGFAKLLLESAGLGTERLIPIKSADFRHQVERPIYSVMGHEMWGIHKMKPMRRWDEAVRDLALRIRREVEQVRGI